MNKPVPSKNDATLNDLTQAEKSSLCVKCQLCCKFLAFQIHQTGTTLEFYKARGLKVTNVSLGVSWIEIPHVCPHLSPTGCRIYKKRPFACERFEGDTHPTTFKDCLWNKERERRRKDGNGKGV